MRADGFRALVCDCVCPAPYKNRSQVSSLKCIIISLCQERRQIVPPPAIPPSHSYSLVHVVPDSISSGVWRGDGG